MNFEQEIINFKNRNKKVELENNRDIKLLKIKSEGSQFLIFLKMLQCLFDETSNDIKVNPQHPDLFDEKKELFLIKEKNKNIGIIRYDRNNKSYRILRTFYIIPEKRNQGIGRIIVKNIEEMTLLENIYSLVLNAESSSQFFYKKLGFNKGYWKGDRSGSIPYGKNLEKF